MHTGSNVITSSEHFRFQTRVHDALDARAARAPGTTRERPISHLFRETLFSLLGNRGDAIQHTGRIDGRHVRRVLVFRYDAVGDYVVTTPLIRWLRTALPDVEVDVISSPRNRSLVDADPYVTRNLTIVPTNLMLNPSLLDLARQTEGRHYDLVFALPTNRMTRAAMLARIIAPDAEKITLLHGPRQGIYGRVFQRQLDRPLGMEHWAQTFLRMATETIVPVVTPTGEFRPHLPLDEAGWRGAEAFMREHELGFDGLSDGIVLGRKWQGERPERFDGEPYCVLNVSAHCSERAWGADRCAAVCAMLLEEYPRLRLFVTGAPAERKRVESVERMVDDPRCRTALLPLRDFIGFIAGAAFVITPDTATAHIAAAAGRPTVGLYAEEIKAAEWYPYGTRFVLLVSPSEVSIDHIEPVEVIEGTRRLIEGAGLGF